MKLACVIHRYGPEIVGGSESHCRQIAEQLAAFHELTVLTTQAQDYVTWANAYPTGRTVVNGVPVIRFPVRRVRRLKEFAALSEEVFETRATVDRQEQWFCENGPDVPELLDYLRTNGRDFDVVLFWSYRYYPAYFGLPLVAERAVLVPTAEEDPAIGLDVLRAYFKKPAGYLFLTPEEQKLVSDQAGQCLAPSAIIGAGLDRITERPGRAALDRLGLPANYVLYLGRIDRNKGCETLFDYFIQHLANGRAETTLVLAGPVRTVVPKHHSICAVGVIDDAVKNALLAYARALIVPSPYESLSISLLEAWNHAVPALVNGGCRVLEGQVRRANGGLYYRSAREFSEALTWLLSHRHAAKSLGVQGNMYVEREYRWPVVLERLGNLLNEVRNQLAEQRA